MSVGALEGQKRALHPLELEFLMIMSLPTWMLGTELRCSERAICTL